MADKECGPCTERCYMKPFGVPHHWLCERYGVRLEGRNGRLVRCEACLADTATVPPSEDQG